MTSEEFPHMDVVEQNQPPREMQFLRILELPERAVRYVPEENVDPNAVVVLKYDALMSVIRELAGGLPVFRRYAAKLEEAIVPGANGQFQAQLETAFATGIAEGYARAIDDLDETAPAAVEEADASLDRLSEPAEEDYQENHPVMSSFPGNDPTLEPADEDPDDESLDLQ